MKDIIYLDLETGEEFSGYKWYREFWKEEWETTDLGEGENGREDFETSVSKADVLEVMDDFFNRCEWCEKVRVIK